jgi:hypothetical protein
MTPLPPGKKRRYKSLTVDRVDLVDRGANFDSATPPHLRRSRSCP